MLSTHWLEVAWSVPLGFGVGVVGTLIGAGGGFILVPLLLLIHPEMNADTITSISLCVVFFNASAGSLSYARMKRIDYKTGLIFSMATIPGAILGAVTTSYISRAAFHLIFGALLLVIAISLLVKPQHVNYQPPRGGLMHVKRTMVDAGGHSHHFSFHLGHGIILSLMVGYLSSLLGIGGGIIHVPALVHLLNFPVHIATATSHFMLAIMALAGSAVHLYQGDLTPHLPLVGALSIGVVLGAPLGARLSNRFQDRWIIRGLAVALGMVGVRILFL